VSKLLFLTTLLTSLLGGTAQAMSTAASFDLSYGILNLGIKTYDLNGTLSRQRTLTSNSVFQIDYNVALFDYKTVATLSFMQVVKSNLGDFPYTRIGIGASYHFIRVNGQRVMLDNQVEGKIWGISPALELTLGLSVLSVNDPTANNLEFTASKIDAIPRLLVEIPAGPSFLIMLRAGFITSLVGGGLFGVKYTGSVFNIGVKLTTF
jgi:hypothetical protein